MEEIPKVAGVKNQEILVDCKRLIFFSDEDSHDGTEEDDSRCLLEWLVEIEMGSRGWEKLTLR